MKKEKTVGRPKKELTLQEEFEKMVEDCPLAHEHMIFLTKKVWELEIVNQYLLAQIWKTPQ